MNRLIAVFMHPGKMIWCVLILFISISLSAQNKKWTLKTADTKIVFVLNPQQQIAITELSNPKNSFNWAAKSPALLLMNRIAIDDTPVSIKWKFKNASVQKDTLVSFLFTSQNPSLELMSEWRAHPGNGPVHHAQFIKNNSGKTITIYDPPSVDIMASIPGVENRVVYVSDDASIPDTIGVYNEPLKDNYFKNLHISENQDWISFLGLNAAAKHGLYIGYEWGIGDMSVKKINNAVAHIDARIGKDFKTDVEDGKTFEIPPAFIGTYSGDLDDLGNSLRKYLFNYSMPAVVRNDKTFPKTEWNAFAALGKGQGSWDPVESKYYPLIDDIAPLGFEELVIDVGWWSDYGDPGHIITDSIDWPHGMVAAGKYARDRGIRFGLYDNEAENLTTDSGRDERIRDITYLIENLKADFYRSDGTGGGVIGAGSFGKGSHAKYKEDIGYWGTQGFYYVIDSLYRRIPGFLWENCSGGGGIKDFGALKRAGRVQNQDIYWPVSARKAYYDASHIYPPMQLASVVGSWAGWQANGSVYDFRSASMGAAYWHPDAPNGGNGGPVWSEKQKEQIKHAVETYKSRLRPLIRTADVYHVFPRPDSVNWDGVEYFDRVKEEGVVYVFKASSKTTPEYTVKLKGLVASKRYHLHFEDGTNEDVVKSGEELMSKGVRIKLEGEEVMSELIFIKRE